MEDKDKITEDNAVQKPALQYLAQINWEVITKNQQDKLNRLRTNKTQTILESVFKQQIKKLNPFLTDEEIDDLLRQLNRLSPSIQGNYEAWKYLRGDYSKKKWNRN